MSDAKDTNPKDAAGSARIDMSLLSPYALAEEALAMEEGGTKYGYFNYTVVGVKSRVYIGALLRHVFKWLLGEERDPKTGVHHLGSARACLGILIDAQVRGKLFDDRPPSQKGASSWLDAMEARVKKVREVFKGFSPRHYSIKDTPDVEGTGEPIHRERTSPAAEGRVQREDAQPVQRRDGGRVVFTQQGGPLDRVQVHDENAEEWARGAFAQPAPAEVAPREKGGRT